MSVTYTAAPQVANIAERLIKEHHEHLVDVNVEYVFRSEHAERHGHVVLGKARKVSGLNAFLVKKAVMSRVEATIETKTGVGVPLESFADTEPFFVIEIAQDIWNVMDKAEREALVDHELCHCRTKVNKDHELQLYVAPHDLEDFNAVVARHGLWQGNVGEFLKALTHGGQLSLESLLDEETDDPAVVDQFTDKLRDSLEPAAQ